MPKAGGVRPQLLVTVDLGWTGPLDREGCRRLACDGTVTRVLVTRQPGDQPPTGQPYPGPGALADFGHGADLGPDATHDPSGDWDADDPSAEGQALQGRLRAAMALLPPTLGGAPTQPLDVGRSTRVVQPAQRSALAVRDRGCVFPDCDRPLAWCEAHHLWHWIDGGPTDLWNLAMVCRAHHRTVHEGGWQLTRGPDGRFTATPGPPTRRPHRRRSPSGA